MRRVLGIVSVVAAGAFVFTGCAPEPGLFYPAAGCHDFPVDLLNDFYDAEYSGVANTLGNAQLLTSTDGKCDGAVESVHTVVIADSRAAAMTTCAALDASFTRAWTLAPLESVAISTQSNTWQVLVVPPGYTTLGANAYRCAPEPPGTQVP